jgi:N-acetylmuramoyl-L-alanine amidase
MKIAAHRLADCTYIPAHSSGGAMTPTIIILHDTAGRLDKFSSVNWFKSEECTTSAHVVIERDGTVVQMVDFNKRAWHAGASEWNGKSNCNAFSIGIEIVNPGKLDKDGRAWFHKKTEKGFTGTKRAKTAEHGDGWWLPYTPEQIKAVTELCKELVTCYPSITEIVTHWLVSPKRKIDTCPLFPIDAVRSEVFTQDGVEAEVAPVQPAIVKPVQAALQSSWTIFNGLLLLIAWIAQQFNAAIQIAIEAAAELTKIQAIKTLATGLNITIAASTLTLIAIFGVFGRRIYAAVAGKIG